MFDLIDLPTLASYIALILYFRTKGGYKPVVLDASH